MKREGKEKTHKGLQGNTQTKLLRLIRNETTERDRAITEFERLCTGEGIILSPKEARHAKTRFDLWGSMPFKASDLFGDIVKGREPETPITEINGIPVKDIAVALTADAFEKIDDDLRVVSEIVHLLQCAGQEAVDSDWKPDMLYVDLLDRLDRVRDIISRKTDQEALSEAAG